jgi:hypothetical protein
MNSSTNFVFTVSNTSLYSDQTWKCKSWCCGSICRSHEERSMFRALLWMLIDNRQCNTVCFLLYRVRSQHTLNYRKMPSHKKSTVVRQLPQKERRLLWDTDRHLTLVYISHCPSSADSLSFCRPNVYNLFCFASAKRRCPQDLTPSQKRQIKHHCLFF